MILPLPVILKRFAAPRLVFIFGIVCLLAASTCRPASSTCCRPSMPRRAARRCATSVTFSAIRSSIAAPELGCVIARPRKNTVTFTRCPSPRKSRMCPTLKSTSCTLVREPSFTSFSWLAARLLPRLLGLLLLRVPELAVVHDPADRRRRGRRDLDQVELLAARRCAERVVRRHHAELRPVGVDHADLAGTDLLVDPDSSLRPSLWDTSWHAGVRRDVRATNASSGSAAPVRAAALRGATVPSAASRSPTTAITGIFSQLRLADLVAELLVAEVGLGAQPGGAQRLRHAVARTPSTFSLTVSTRTCTGASQSGKLARRVLEQDGDEALERARAPRGGSSPASPRCPPAST